MNADPHGGAPGIDPDVDVAGGAAETATFNIKRYVRPPLYDKQREAIFDARDYRGRPARIAIIEASTKSGKTVGCLAWIVEEAVRRGGAGHNFWWIAPVYAQAAIAYRRMKLALDPGDRRTNDQDLTVTLANGSVIWFKSGEKPDNLYGEDVYGSVIDEASRLRKESWEAIRSTLTKTRGKVRIIGNVKGRGNWFYKLARKAEGNEPGYCYTKITAYDAVAGGVLDHAEIEQAKADLDEDTFKQLYLAEPADDEGNPFGYTHIAACTMKDERGRASDAISENAPVVYGVDLAKTMNWSVIIGLDRQCVVAGFDRFRLPWAETKKRILENVGHQYTLIDSTGVGDPIVEELSARRHTIEGFKFTAPSKQMLMEALKLAIQQHIIRFPKGPIVAELENFEYSVMRTGTRYCAPDGYNDDCVMALALAYECWRRNYAALNHDGPGIMSRVSPWHGAGSGGVPSPH